MSLKHKANCYRFATGCRKLYFFLVWCFKPKRLGNTGVEGHKRKIFASFSEGLTEWKNVSADVRRFRMKMYISEIYLQKTLEIMEI